MWTPWIRHRCREGDSSGCSKIPETSINGKILKIVTIFAAQSRACCWPGGMAFLVKLGIKLDVDSVQLYVDPGVVQFLVRERPIPASMHPGGCGTHGKEASLVQLKPPSRAVSSMSSRA